MARTTEHDRNSCVIYMTKLIYSDPGDELQKAIEQKVIAIAFVPQNYRRDHIFFTTKSPYQIKY